MLSVAFSESDRSVARAAPRVSLDRKALIHGKGFTAMLICGGEAAPQKAALVVIACSC